MEHIRRDAVQASVQAATACKAMLLNMMHCPYGRLLMQVGFKLLAADVKFASRLVHRVLHGKSLGR